MTRRVRIAALAVTILFGLFIAAGHNMNAGRSVNLSVDQPDAPAVFAPIDRASDVRRRQEIPDRMKINMAKCEVVLPRVDGPCVR